MRTRDKQMYLRQLDKRVAEGVANRTAYGIVTSEDHQLALKILQDNVPARVIELVIEGEQKVMDATARADVLRGIVIEQAEEIDSLKETVRNLRSRPSTESEALETGSRIAPAPR